MMPFGPTHSRKENVYQTHFTLALGGDVISTNAPREAKLLERPGSQQKPLSQGPEEVQPQPSRATPTLLPMWQRMCQRGSAYVAKWGWMSAGPCPHLCWG